MAPTRPARTVSAPYDRLVLATGSVPFMLPVPGADLAGVLAYRDIADTQALIDAAARYPRAVVIGGGVLGLEAANGLMMRGMQVTVVHAGEWLMERQLDDVAARPCCRPPWTRSGMKFLLARAPRSCWATTAAACARCALRMAARCPPIWW